MTTTPAAEPVEAVAHGELVSGTPEAVRAAEEAERREAVEEPAKVMRIGAMIKQLLEEVRGVHLDEGARDRLKEIYDTSIAELGSALSPDLLEELRRVAIPFGEGETPSASELRVAHAQLMGWLEGLFHGIQATLFAQQMAARAQLEDMRRQLPAGGQPGSGGQPGPGGPSGFGPSTDPGERSGTYL